MQAVAPAKATCSRRASASRQPKQRSYGFQQSLDEARARFRKVVGLEPHNLRWPGRLPDLPATKDATLAIAVRYNPTIRAAQADADAAKYGYRSTAGAFVPSVALEGRGDTGTNYNNLVGRRDELSGKVVFSWDVFRGGQDLWRRNEMAERYIENTQRHARLQRDALESIDKAWSARAYSGDRIGALSRQVAADRRTIDAYTKEYELGQRSLIDLLNAQNSLFTASVSLVSIQSLAIFADFQMLAAMGHLLAYLNEPHTIDARAADASLRLRAAEACTGAHPRSGYQVRTAAGEGDHRRAVAGAVGKSDTRIAEGPVRPAAGRFVPGAVLDDQLQLDDGEGVHARSRCQGRDDRRGRAGDIRRADELRCTQRPSHLAAEADRRQIGYDARSALPALQASSTGYLQGWVQG